MMSIADVLINLFECIILSAFMTKILQVKRNILLCFLVFVISSFCLVNIFNYYFIYEDLYIFVYILLLFLVSKVFSKRSNSEMIINSFIVVSLVSLSNISALVLVSFFSKIEISQIIFLNDDLFLDAIILSKILLVIYEYFTYKQLSKAQTLSAKYFVEFISGFFIARLLLNNVETMIFNRNRSDEVVIITAFLLAAFVGLMLNIYNLVQKDNKEETHRKVMIEKMDSYKEQFKLVQESNSQIKILRHDLNNSFTLIDNYMKSCEYDKVREIVVKKRKDIYNIECLIETGIAEIDYLVNYKLHLAKSLGIQFVSNIGDICFPNISTLEFYDLIGNALDNAIENTGNEKKVTLKMIKFGSKLLIRISNSINCSILENNPALKSTKENDDKHGFGVQSMKNIVNRNKGLLEFKEENNEFICTITLDL